MAAIGWSLRRRLLPLLAALPVLLAAPGATSQEWVEVRSPNFTVATDAGEKRGREVALRFEQMRQVFGSLTQKKFVSIPVPLQVFAFRSNKEMKHYLPLWKGKPIDAAGLFIGSEDRNFILLDLSAENRWRAVFHEYGHMLLNGNFPPSQPWFDEGFAEYFSTLEVQDREAHIGNLPDYAGDILFHNRLLPVADLFSVGKVSPIYNERGDRRTLFYAESWLVVHYLYDHRERFHQVNTYFRLVNQQHLPVAEAIRQAFGMEPAQLDKELDAYLRSNRFTAIGFKLEAGAGKNGITARALDPLDAQVALADVHLYSPDYTAQAIEEYESVLRARPEQAGAQRGLGYAYLQRSDFDKAAEHFRRAAALDSKDPRVHYYSALLAVREFAGAAIPAEKAAEMRKHLETAIALAPGFADAYNLLAIADDLTGDHDAALANIQKAVDLSPRNDSYALNLARIYLQLQRWKEAEVLLQRLKQSQEGVVAANAGRYLEELAARNEQRARVAPPVIQAPVLAPQWQSKKPVSTDELEKPETPPSGDEPVPLTTPIQYLRGQLLGVDCSLAPAALVTIQSGGKTWKMLARDAKKLIVIGADQLSCDWKNRKVLVNYRPGGKYDAELVTLEVQ